MNTVEKGSDVLQVISEFSKVSALFKKHEVSVADKAAQNMFRVLEINKKDQNLQNSVWMSRDDYEEFFPKSLSETHQQLRFVSIADKVYRVAILHWLKKGLIALNPLHKHDVRNGIFSLNLDEMLIATAFKLEEQNVRLLRGVGLELEVWKFNRVPKDNNVICLDLNKLRNILQIALSAQVLSMHQSFIVRIGPMIVKASVRELDFPEKDILVDELDFEEGDYGVITQDTILDLRTLKDSRISVVDKVFSSAAMEFQFTVTPRVDTEVSETDRSSYPPPMGYDIMVEKIKEQLTGQEILKGEKITLKHGEGWEFSVEFSKVNTGEVKMESPAGDYAKKFRFLEEQPVLLKWNSTEMTLTSGKARELKKIEFNVIDYTGSDRDQELESFRKPWLNVQELREQIAKLDRPFVRLEKFHLELSSGEYILQANKVEGVEKGLEDKRANVKDQWLLSAGSEIDFKVGPKLDLTLVATNKGYPLKKVSFKVSPINPMRYDFSEYSILSRKLILEFLKEHLQKKLVPLQTFDIDVGFGSKLRVTVRDFDFNTEPLEEIPPETVFESCGKIQNETELVFVNDETAKVKVLSEVKEFQIDNPTKRLEEMGLGGLSEKMEEIVREIFLFHGKLKTLALKRGIKPGKGILFFGPPGTGKTAFARCLAEMLGVQGENVALISAPEVFKKWVGSSEENVRKLFRPARLAQKKLGENSPLFVVIIDEIDAMLGLRADDGNSVRNSVVNQFLAEVDGPKPLKNILVIGMTNRKDRMDPAALRPGRFDIQIEIGIPDAKGRGKIFEIHAKKLIEEDLIAEDVSFDSLVSKTSEWTGAEIEAVVKKANVLAFERLSKLKLSIPELENHPEGKVKGEDFEAALEKLAALKSEGFDISKSMIYM